MKGLEATIGAAVMQGLITPRHARQMIRDRDHLALAALTRRGVPEDLARWTLTQPEVDATAIALSAVSSPPHPTT